MDTCHDHHALRTRLDRNGIATLSPAERGQLARCPRCGPQIVELQDALGALVALGPLEPDLDDEDDNDSWSIPIDTTMPPNAWMADIARPVRQAPKWTGTATALALLVLAAVAAIVI